MSILIDKAGNSFSGSAPVGKTSTLINLRRLCVIRWIVLGGEIIALIALYILTTESLKYPILFVSIAVMALINLITHFRIQRNQVLSEKEFFAHLLIDIFYLTLILYLAGGSTNPFVSYYLIPLIISAAVLDHRFTWGLAAITLVLYTSLFFVYQPLKLFTAHDTDLVLNPHFIGMWINFGFSALLISYFVVNMGRTLKEQADAIAKNRERLLRDEQILSFASLTAGAAHELRTPLSTMKILVDELRSDNPLMAVDFDVIDSQISRCENKLKEMVTSASTGTILQKQKLSDLIGPLLSRWQLLKPEVKLIFHADDADLLRKVNVDQTFEQAIISYLNNAAEASPNEISLTIRSDETQVELLIKDRGLGINNSISDDIGKVFISNKEKGLGMGVLLSQSSIERLKGRVEQFDRQQGGLETKITLPLEKT